MCYFFAYFSHGLPIFKLGKLSILSVSLFVALTNWLYNGFTFLSFDSGPNFRVFTGAADVEGAAYVLIDIKGAGVAAAGTTGAGGGHPLCLAAAAGKGTLFGGGQPLCLAAAAETEKNSWNNHTKWEKIRYIKNKKSWNYYLEKVCYLMEAGVEEAVDSIFFLFHQPYKKLCK